MTLHANGIEHDSDSEPEAMIRKSFHNLYECIIDLRASVSTLATRVERQANADRRQNVPLLMVLAVIACALARIAWKLP